MPRVWILVRTPEGEHRFLRTAALAEAGLLSTELSLALQTGRPEILTFQPDGGETYRFACQDLLGVGIDPPPEPGTSVTDLPSLGAEDPTHATTDPRTSTPPPPEAPDTTEPLAPESLE